jgi:hypothetical protein
LSAFAGKGATIEHSTHIGNATHIPVGEVETGCRGATIEHSTHSGNATHIPVGEVETGCRAVRYIPSHALNELRDVGNFLPQKAYFCLEISAHLFTFVLVNICKYKTNFFNDQKIFKTFLFKMDKLSTI